MNNTEHYSQDGLILRKTPESMTDTEKVKKGPVGLHNFIRGFTSAVQQVLGVGIGGTVGTTAGIAAMTIPMAVVPAAAGAAAAGTVVLSGGLVPLGGILGAVAGWRMALKSKLPERMAQWMAPVRNIFRKTNYRVNQVLQPETPVYQMPQPEERLDEAA